MTISCYSILSLSYPQTQTCTHNLYIIIYIHKTAGHTRLICVCVCIYIYIILSVPFDTEQRYIYQRVTLRIYSIPFVSLKSCCFSAIAMSLSDCFISFVSNLVLSRIVLFNVTANKLVFYAQSNIAVISGR